MFIWKILIGSNAPISKDLKQEIANLIAEASQMMRFLILWKIVMEIMSF